MHNTDNVIVTPWKIEEVPLNHWFKRIDNTIGPRRITGFTADERYAVLGGSEADLFSLATKFLHSEHPVGPNADWQRCGHIEPRGVVWVGRGDLYFRKDTAVINGVRYAVDGAEAVTISKSGDAIYPFRAESSDRSVCVSRDGEWVIGNDSVHGLDVLPAIRMEAK